MGGLPAVIASREKAVAAGQWQESKAIEPLCPGAWWDLVDPENAAEADLDAPALGRLSGPSAGA
jgi:hypothetical protein